MNTSKSLIYRIEDKNHEGPYRTGSIAWTHIKHSCPIKYPLLSEDKILPAYIGLEIPGNFSVIFGFESIFKLKDWFSPNELANLYKLKYYCTVYLCARESYIHGDKQSVILRESFVFNKDYIPVSYIPLNTINNTNKEEEINKIHRRMQKRWL